MQGRDVIFEFIPSGAYVRVSAMDTATLTEIVITGAANAPRDMLEQNALKRLEYVLKKKGLI